MIKLLNIYKKYNNNIVLSNINFTFDCNKIYIIKGPSGCGKTTLLNILSGIDNDYDGCYYFNSVNVMENLNYLKKSVGYVFQNSLLISNLTVIDNLLLISTNIDKINYYSELFKVKNILHKYPNQISGGERQRISIIRSLLVDSKLIICDEPTSSLDRKTAKIIVKELSRLKSKKRIIIISTHDDIFDDIADSVIYLDYGRVSNVKNNETCNNNNEIVYNGKKIIDNFKDIDKKYVKKRIKKNTRTKIIISSMMLFMLIFFGIKDNFKLEVLKMMSEEYPINTFHIYEYRDEYDFIDSVDNLKVYNNYFYSNDEIDYYSLPDREDSIFKNKDFLYAGKFPLKDNEILISYTYAQEINDDVDALIDKFIIIDEDRYVISGIISNDLRNINLINDSNHYYHLNSSSKAVFMLENEIKKKVDIYDTDFLLVSYDNLYNDNNVLKKIKEKNINLYWESVVDNYQYTIDLIFNIVVIVIICSSVIAFLFINNEILFKLEFRKKEIGYLQIFNVSKNRIKNILIKEYLNVIIKSIITSIIIFMILSSSILLIFNINIIPNVFKIIGLLIFILIYIYLLVTLPINKMLKKDIITLIR